MAKRSYIAIIIVFIVVMYRHEVNYAKALFLLIPLPRIPEEFPSAWETTRTLLKADVAELGLVY